MTIVKDWNIGKVVQEWGFCIFIIVVYVYCRVPEGRGLHQSPPDLYVQRQDTVPKPFSPHKGGLFLAHLHYRGNKI